MFVWDNGLRLANGLAVDITRRQKCAFVSHAHADHIARHALALCTPETAALYKLRLGERPVSEMNLFEPLDWSGYRLKAYPAGHCLGSAMLLAEDMENGQTLLYTGDFKLGPSATSREAVLPHADILVMECTFGTPKYRMPPRDEVIAEFIALVKQTFEQGALPVVFAYNLGKSQEVTKILTEHGFKVQQYSAIHEISLVYEKFGVALGDVIPCSSPESVENDRVLMVPPYVKDIQTKLRTVTFTLTGWAVESGAKYRFGVEHALALSDHADYDDLIDTVKTVDPKIVYCTHGPLSFVDELLDLGINARPVDRPWQGRLF